VARSAVAHGYLLCGPRGTGKTTLARILFKALNCAQPLDGEPCGECHSCVTCDAGRAIDLTEIDAASNRGIDDIRALRERVRFAPAEASWKVYIVDEAHQLTAPAWDAFLKTLEEPPPHTVFVLATTAAHKVPATIVSRCQRFDLGRIPQPIIADQLARVAVMEGIALERGVAERVARLADGGLRDALGMLEQVAVFGGSPVTLEAARRVLGLVRGDAIRSFLDGLAYGDTRRALEVLEGIAEEGADLHQFLNEVLFELRCALLMRAGAESALLMDLGSEERDWLREITGRWAPGHIAEILTRFADAETAGANERQLLVRLELAAAALAIQKEPTVAPAGGGSPSLAAPSLATKTSMETPPATPIAAEVGPAPLAAKPERATAGEPHHVHEGGADYADPLPHQNHSGAVAEPASPPAPSLAAVQARWSSLLDRFQGNLFAKTLVARLTPSQLDNGVVVLEGKLTAIDRQRLEASARKHVEEMLLEEFKTPLSVRIAESAPNPREGAETDNDSIAEYASKLFGGRLLEISPDPQSMGALQE